jgi:hypothetical protein
VITSLGQSHGNGPLGIEVTKAIQEVECAVMFAR